MIVFITTQMRTGSTWLCDIIAGLFGVRWDFFNAQRHNHSPDFFKRHMNAKDNKVYKLHHTHPKYICEDSPNNVRVLSITRDLKDTILSNLFYIRYDNVLPSINDRLKNYRNVRSHINGRLNDRDYINKYIKEQHQLIRGWVQEWKGIMMVILIQIIC